MSGVASWLKDKKSASRNAAKKSNKSNTREASDDAFAKFSTLSATKSKEGREDHLREGYTEGMTQEDKDKLYKYKRFPFNFTSNRRKSF